MNNFFKLFFLLLAFSLDNRSFGAAVKPPTAAAILWENFKVLRREQEQKEQEEVERLETLDRHASFNSALSINPNIGSLAHSPLYYLAPLNKN